MNRYLNIAVFWRLSLLAVLAILIINCTSEKYKESTDETVNITGYLESNQEQYSMFLEILETTNYSTFMNTYGTYTLFLPTNEAVQNYLDEEGFSSISDIPLEDLEDLAKLHILEERIETVSFNDGKIATPSMQGQFLITGAANVGGTSNITVNKDARITASNIEVGNGIIHVIDKMLKVAKQTLAEMIDANDSLSIFSTALKETGWYDLLDEPLTYDEDSIPTYLTVIAQTNEVFGDNGINSYADLENRYSHLNDPMNPSDSLNLFMAYRIVPGLNYLADLVGTSTVLTKAPLEVIGIQLKRDSIVLNEETFNDVFEEGVAIDRSLSDITASNGALHFVDDNFFIKKRFPAPVYFDPADQPEFRQLSSVFRKPGMSAALFRDELSEVNYEGGNYDLVYSAPEIGSRTGRGWHGDVLEIFRFRTGVINNLELTTPVIIKGQYKVWVSYRASSRQPRVKAFFNGQELPRIANFSEYGNTELPERVLESQGYKRHIHPYDDAFYSRLMGIINVETTGRHKIMLQSMDNSGYWSWLDVIEFRPVDMDQLYPKFESGGDGLIYESDIN